MSDQADELRELVRVCDVVEPRPRTLRSLIVVAGGKGGVGTTTIATNLAAMLATLGESTVLVDADFQRADATTLCRLTPQRSLTDVLTNRANTDDVLHRHETGMLVLPSAWAPDCPLEMTATIRHRFLTVLGELDSQASFVVVDAGNQRTTLSSQLWQIAAHVLVVTTPDDVAVMDTYATIKTLADKTTARQSKRARIATLVNKIDDVIVAEEIQDRLETSARRFLGMMLDSAGAVNRCSWLEHQRRTGWLGGGLPASEEKSFFQRLAMTQQVLQEQPPAAAPSYQRELVPEERSSIESTSGAIEYAS